MNDELMQAISDMMDRKLQPINDKLNSMDNRLDSVEKLLSVIEFKEDRASKKLNDLQLDVKISERDVRRDIHSLRDELDTVIELLKIHKIMPL